MLNFNIFEQFSCILKPSLFRRTNTKFVDDGLNRNIYNVSKEYKISVLPILPDFDIDNLYPITDKVHTWSTFIVGNDKTYILANITDSHICIPYSENLINHKGINILADELTAFFDIVWTNTLSGKQLQFYMVWNGKLYFVNTYPFFNGKKKVIGAIMFMRAFETMPPTKFSTTLDGYIVPQKLSSDSNDNKKPTPAEVASKVFRSLKNMGNMDAATST